MLRIKCILHKPELQDGLRISVMSEHTLNDGITLDERITEYDIHFHKLGPSPKLIGAYYRKEIIWPEFVVRYCEEMKDPKKIELIKMIAKYSEESNVTLMCIEESADFCHRRILETLCNQHVDYII